MTPHNWRLHPEKPCIICGDPSIARDMCRTHYSRWYRSLETGIDDDVRVMHRCSVEWCDELTKLEFCRTHMNRLRIFGSPFATVPITEDAINRFWAQVEIDDDDKCWQWTGLILRPRGRRVYGILKKSGGFSTVYAHRIAWLLDRNRPFRKNEAITWPVCDNTLCQNTRHMTTGDRNLIAAERRWRKEPSGPSR